jgi:metal-responsive CopG/Arc/MetJ family transcriptional regulator
MVWSAAVARAQTLVQLTDELVDRLDRRAAREGVSRSALIRELLADALDDPSHDEVSERIIEGYSRAPQAEERDQWGDLSEWNARNAARNLAALSEEEEQPW